MRNDLRRELEWMRRQPQARETKQRARINRFYELEAGVRERGGAAKAGADIDSKSRRLGDDVMECEGVRLASKAGDGKKILAGFDFTLSPGGRVAVVGPNGVGKTTFLEVLAGNVEPDEGVVKRGETVVVGYFDQKGLRLEEGEEEVREWKGKSSVKKVSCY